MISSVNDTTTDKKAEVTAGPKNNKVLNSLDERRIMSMPTRLEPVQEESRAE